MAGETGAEWQAECRFNGGDCVAGRMLVWETYNMSWWWLVDS